MLIGNPINVQGGFSVLLSSSYQDMNCSVIAYVKSSVQRLEKSLLLTAGLFSNIVAALNSTGSLRSNFLFEGWNWIIDPRTKESISFCAGLFSDEGALWTFQPRLMVMVLTLPVIQYWPLWTTSWPLPCTNTVSPTKLQRLSVLYTFYISCTPS